MHFLDTTAINFGPPQGMFACGIWGLENGLDSRMVGVDGNTVAIQIGVEVADAHTTASVSNSVML